LNKEEAAMPESASKSEIEAVHCSFCGKSQHEVRKLIAANGSVFICNECVGLCAEICVEVGLFVLGPAAVILNIAESGNGIYEALEKMDGTKVLAKALGFESPKVPIGLSALDLVRRIASAVRDEVRKTADRQSLTRELQELEVRIEEMRDRETQARQVLAEAGDVASEAERIRAQLRELEST
jgi:hypothetical protein